MKVTGGGQMLGAITVGDTPGEFLRKNHERWARVIKAAGVTARQ